MLATVARLADPVGVRAVVAEKELVEHQLLSFNATMRDGSGARVETVRHSIAETN